MQELETNTKPVPRLYPHGETLSKRTSSYRFSMANLEETHEAELDVILRELSILEQLNIGSDSRAGAFSIQPPNTNLQMAGVDDVVNRHERAHIRSNSILSGVTNASISTSSESGTGSGSDSGAPLRESRTDSPDNDSAFSDTVSLLSSASSSASSGISHSNHRKNVFPFDSNSLNVSRIVAKNGFFNGK